MEFESGESTAGLEDAVELKRCTPKAFHWAWLNCYEIVYPVGGRRNLVSSGSIPSEMTGCQVTFGASACNLAS